MRTLKRAAYLMNHRPLDCCASKVGLSLPPPPYSGEIMRYIAVLVAALLLPGCSTAPAPRIDPELASAPPESVQQFLLTSAATDFVSHGPSRPTRFRDVRIGSLASPGEDKRYILCGEFLPPQDASNAGWIPFATIKTSDYEQWLGPQAVTFCRLSVNAQGIGDLSSALQSRLDSLR